MQGTMTTAQCHRVLLNGLVGRVGCYAKGRVYVVPISYVFEKGHIYAHAKEGNKVNAMRQHPNVCFQIDEVDNMTSWRSVMIWGKFDEITNSAQQTKAIKILSDRFNVFQTSESVKPSQHTDGQPYKERRPVLYRISVEEISGRFEKPAM